jgi:hypothetical protein
MRAAAGEPALLEQQALLLGMHELGHVHVGRQRVVGVQPRDLGIDERRPALSSQRHAVMAVGHEEQPADLVDLDRRNVPRREGRAQRCKPRARQRATRLEVATEVGAPVDRPDDPLQRHRAHAPVGLADDPQPALHLVERQQVHYGRIRMSFPWAFTGQSHDESRYQR